MKFIMQAVLLVFFVFSALNARGEDDSILKDDVFDGSKFSAAFAIEFYGDEYIEEAALIGDQKTVQVLKSYETRNSGWLMYSVYPFKDVGKQKNRVGFFAGVKAVGEGATFQDIALGVHFAFGDTNGNSNLIAGIGYGLHSTRRFADGIQENEPLPERFENILYKESSEGAWMIFVGGSF